QPYADSVFVAGRRLEAGDSGDFELLIDGPYRWIPLGGPHALHIDDTTLEPGQVMELPAGRHAAQVSEGGAGLLVLAVSDPPGLAPLHFYEPS
ncbi:MAG: hypothetical protein ACQGVC_22640, partial [Myxococcota bacterium]